MRKRSLSLLIVMAMVTTLLVGCGAPEASKEPTTTENAGEVAKSDVTLTFGAHQSGMPTSGIVQKLAEEFEAETGIKVDFQITPDDQWRDLLKAKLDSGEAYDIMCVDADPLSLYSRINPEENCVDLSNEEWASRIDPIVVPGLSYNDKLYGIQFNGTRISTTFYNKEVFERLNLEVPTTFEEFKVVCDAILESGMTPLYEACQNGWHQVLPLFETGSYYASLYDGLYDKLNKNEMEISDVKEMGQILEQMKEIADAGYLGADYMSQSVEGAAEAFGTEQVAMYYDANGWLADFLGTYPEMEEKIGVFSFPWADNQTVSVNPTNNAYFINNKSKNIEECKKFFEFLARPENLQKRLDEGGIASVCWPEIPSNENPIFVEYMDSLPQGMVMQVGVSYIDPQWMDVGKDIDAMYAGTMAPAEVFANIAKRRTEQAELQKDPAWQ